MTKERIHFEKIVELLDSVASKYVAMHSAPQEFGTGIPLYRSEIHTLQAIGENPGVNVTRLAEIMNVTKGAVSQTIAKLVKKQLIFKTFAPDNAKEVLLNLTKLGWTGYENHELVHREMFRTVKDFYGRKYKKNQGLVIKVLTDLDELLSSVENTHNQ